MSSSSSSRVFRNLRRRRRPRPLLLFLQATFLRPHGSLAHHPDECTRLPAHHSDAGGVIDGTLRPRQRDASSYAAMVAAHLGRRDRDLPRAEALYRAAAEAARGPDLDTVMLDGYAKAGRVGRARRLFDAMPERSVVSWTAMVHGYARARMLSEARETFDRMPRRNVVSWTVMVKAYADGGRVQEAMELFDRMPQRNSYSWNAVISGSFRAGRVDEAVRLFERMQHRNVVSWTVMVTGLAQNGRVSMAREFFDMMPYKDTTAWNAMITAYANNGQMDETRRLFNSMPAKDMVSWNIVIDGYAKNELKDEASGLFLHMLRSAASPNSTTLISVLIISESMVEVVQIHGLATTLGLLSETSLGNALLTMYSRIGDLPSAWLAFKRLEEKDVITWTSMIQAFANHGHASYALQAFAQMLQHGNNPSSTTFTAVLSACSHAGLVEKGKSIFRSIRHVYGLERTIEHYTCLVDILGRAGHVREAMDVVAAMPPDMCDDAILGTLLGACMMHKEVDAAREVGEVLAKSDPSGSGGYYMALANVLASGGLWDEMAGVWKAMKGSDVRKTPGVSQITVDARKHAFFSRDQMHPQCAEIYEMLDYTLVPDMKKIVETVCQTCN